MNADIDCLSSFVGLFGYHATWGDKFDTAR
jgi:hypothetical protein